MYIRSLTVKNFGIIKDEVVFKPEDGINLISGINGSGKSTIYKAILLLLFNKTDKKLEEYVNEEISFQDGFEISLDLDIDKMRFFVKYKFSKKGKTGSSVRELYVGDPLPDEPQYLNSDAVAAMEMMLSPQLGMAGLISRQGENDVINIKPAERREHLKQIYDLDFTNEIESVEAEIQHYDNDVLPDIEKQIYHIENKEYAAESLYDLPFSETKRDEYQEKLTDIAKRLTEAETYQEKLQQLDAQIHTKQTTLNGLADKLDVVQDDIEDLEDSQKSLQEKLSDPDTQVLDKLYENMHNRDKFDRELRSIDEKMHATKLFRLKSFDYNHLEEVKEKYIELKTQLEQSKEKLNLVQNGVCPTCGRPFEEHDEMQYASDIESLEAQVQEQKEVVEDLEHYRKKYEEKKEDLEQRKREKELLQQKRENLIERENEQLEDLQRQIDREKKRFEERTEENEASLADVEKRIEKKNAEKTELENELNKLKTEIKSEEERLSSMKEENYDVEALKEAKTKLEEKLDEYKTVLAQNEMIQKRNSEIEKQKKLDQQKLDELYIQRDSKYTERAAFEEARNIFRKEFPNYVILEMVKSLETGINDFIDKVYYKPLNIEISESRNAINITYGNQRKKDVAHLSGAEKQLVSLAYKNYLNQMIGLGVIMLDEVDSNYTDENAERLYDIIGSMSDYYKQVFVISHNEQAKNKLTGEYEAAYVEFADGSLVA